MIAHRGGNHLDALRDAERLGIPLVEADLRLFRGRIDVRHLKSVGPLPLFWDRWRLAAPWTRRLSLDELLQETGRQTELMLDLKGRNRSLANLVARTIAPFLSERRFTICARAAALLEPLAWTFRCDDSDRSGPSGSSPIPAARRTRERRRRLRPRPALASDDGGAATRGRRRRTWPVNRVEHSGACGAGSRRPDQRRPGPAPGGGARPVISFARRRRVGVRGPLRRRGRPLPLRRARAPDREPRPSFARLAQRDRRRVPAERACRTRRSPAPTSPGSLSTRLPRGGRAKRRRSSSPAGEFRLIGGDDRSVPVAHPRVRRARGRCVVRFALGSRHRPGVPSPSVGVIAAGGLALAGRRSRSSSECGVRAIRGFSPEPGRVSPSYADPLRADRRRRPARRLGLSDRRRALRPRGVRDRTDVGHGRARARGGRASTCVPVPGGGRGWLCLALHGTPRCRALVLDGMAGRGRLGNAVGLAIRLMPTLRGWRRPPRGRGARTG